MWLPGRLWKPLRQARGEARVPWVGWMVEPPKRIELLTYALRVGRRTFGGGSTPLITTKTVCVVVTPLVFLAAAVAASGR